MPLFDHECAVCGAIFEALVLHEGEDVACPRCGTLATKRVPVSLFSCFSAQLDKRLTLQSRDQIAAGRARLKTQTMRRRRIKIL